MNCLVDLAMASAQLWNSSSTSSKFTNCDSQKWMISHGISRKIFRHPGSSWDKLSMDLLVVVNSRPQLRTGCWLLLRDVGIWTHRDGQARTKDVQTCLQHLWLFQTLRSRRAVRSPGFLVPHLVSSLPEYALFLEEKKKYKKKHCQPNIFYVQSKSMANPWDSQDLPRLHPGFFPGFPGSQHPPLHLLWLF